MSLTLGWIIPKGLKNPIKSYNFYIITTYVILPMNFIRIRNELLYNFLPISLIHSIFRNIPTSVWEFYFTFSLCLQLHRNFFRQVSLSRELSFERSRPVWLTFQTKLLPADERARISLGSRKDVGCSFEK